MGAAYTTSKPTSSERVPARPHLLKVPQPLQNSTTDEVKAGNQEFKASISYMASLRTTWNIGVPVKTRKMKSKMRKRRKGRKRKRTKS